MEILAVILFCAFLVLGFAFGQYLGGVVGDYFANRSK